MEGQWPVGRGSKDRGTSVHTDSSGTALGQWQKAEP